jgi:hypothetical protein
MNPIQQENNNKKGAVKYIFRLLLQRIIGIGLFFAAAGGFNDIRGIVNVSLYLIISIVIFLNNKEIFLRDGERFPSESIL